MNARIVLLCFCLIFVTVSCNLFTVNITEFLSSPASSASEVSDRGNTEDESVLEPEPAIISLEPGPLNLVLEDNGTYSIVGVNSDYSGIIQIPASYNGIEIKAIKERAFENNNKITGVFIADGIETIGEKAFQGCENIQSISLGETIETIGSEAFSSCTGLTNLIIPISVVNYGANLFGDSTVEIFLENSSITKNDLGSLWNPNGNVVYEADAWHKVSFNSNGGSRIPSVPIITTNNVISKLPTPVLQGSMFEAWYSDMWYTTVFEEGSSRVLAEITLYAKWKP